jgi:hypothetical protein
VTLITAIEQFATAVTFETRIPEVLGSNLVLTSLRFIVVFLRRSR